jgi:hypothetical protein
MDICLIGGKAGGSPLPLLFLRFTGTSTWQTDLDLSFIDTCHQSPAYSEVRTDICQKRSEAFPEALNTGGCELAFRNPSLGLKWR